MEALRWEQLGGRASVGARTSVNDCSHEITASCRSCRMEYLARRTRFHWGESDVCWEEAGECTSRAPRGMGPSTYTRIAEITSGRSHFQQGLTATCEDREEELMQSRRGGFGIGTWARMSCEEGVTPFEVILEVTPGEVTPQRGKGALGAWWAKGRSAGRGIDPTNSRFQATPNRGPNL